MYKPKFCGLAETETVRGRVERTDLINSGVEAGALSFTSIVILDASYLHVVSNPPFDPET